MRISTRDKKATAQATGATNMRPMTRDEVLEQNGLGPKTSTPDEKLYFQTGNPAFLFYANPDIPGGLIHEDEASAEVLMFYWNTMLLLKASALSMDTVIHIFSNINSKSTYSKFLDGKGYQLLNIRMASELMDAFDLNEEEMRMMFSGPVVLSGKPTAGKINKSRIGTKDNIAKQFSIIFNDLGLSPLNDETLDDEVKKKIRTCVSGRTYPHLDVFMPVCRYCGMDALKLIECCQHLNMLMKSDPDFNLLSFKNNEGQDLEAFSCKHMVGHLDIDQAINELMGLYAEQTTELDPEKKDVFQHNLEQIAKDTPEIMDAVADMLSESSLSLSALTNFLATAIGVQVYDIMFKPLNHVKMVDETNENEAEEEESEELPFEATPEEEEATEPQEVPMTNEPEIQAEDADIKADNNDAAEQQEENMEATTHIEVDMRKKFRCSKTSWKNENPDKKSEGYYWDRADAEECKKVAELIQTINERDLSINSITEVLKPHLDQDSVKIHVEIASDCGELSLGFSI